MSSRLFIAALCLLLLSTGVSPCAYATPQGFEAEFRSLPANELLPELDDHVPIDSVVTLPGFTEEQAASTQAAFGKTYFEQQDNEPLTFNSIVPIANVPPVHVAPATSHVFGMELVAPFQNRHHEQVASSEVPSPIAMPAMPDEFEPWWTQIVTSSIGIQSEPMAVSLNSLIQDALRHSPHIQLAAAEPHIRQSNVFEEASQFDWTSFLESQYDDKNDPVGNTLTTGNDDDRFRQQEWYAKGGVRRKNNVGGQTELTQRLGYLDSNSRFLIPPNQGSSRLELNYRHPLMKGRGLAVNESLIILADIDFRSASDTYLEELQNHLAEVTETFWELVRARSEYLQRKRLLASAEEILRNLEGRAGMDALERQVFRAKAVVANRRAEIARSFTSIKNAESRMRLLVNEPRLLTASGLELTPLDTPMPKQLPINLADAVSTAIINRPDISRAIRAVKAAEVRSGVAENDLLPKLDLLVGSYVAGLDGDSDSLNSWVNQFKDGRPGFNVGVEFELPIGNRAANARRSRRYWEKVKALQQFRAVVETGITEVEISVREVKTAYQEMVGRYHSMAAADTETKFLVDRWKTLPDIDDSVTLLLEDMLDSQERLADEEAAYAKAQFDFSVATVQLKKVMGVLFQVQR